MVKTGKTLCGKKEKVITIKTRKMQNRIKVVLGLSSLTPEAKVTRAQNIHDAIQASGNFPNSGLPVSYTNVQAAIDNLSSSIVAANAVNSSSADTSFMHEQERLLVGIFNLLRSHVEFSANNTLDPGTIITSAGMGIATPGGQNAVTELTVEASGGGKITVRVPRGEGEKAFIFETSADGNSWTKAGSSSLTKIVLSGFAVASTVNVRYYGITKTGDSDMSQPKSVLVV
jgi:hypothetical protein